MATTKEQLYASAIETFGEENQIHVALEELSELQKELCKDLRGSPNYTHIAEEIADAEIMLEQLRFIYAGRLTFDDTAFNATVSAYKHDKLLRLEKRIKERADG